MITEIINIDNCSEEIRERVLHVFLEWLNLGKDTFSIYELSCNMSYCEYAGKYLNISSSTIRKANLVNINTFEYVGIDGSDDLIFYHCASEFGKCRDTEILDADEFLEKYEDIILGTNIVESKEERTLAEVVLNLQELGCSYTTLYNVMCDLGGEASEGMATFSDKSELVIKSTTPYFSKVVDTYPQYREYESGMLVLKTEPTKGVIIWLPDGDLRGVGTLLKGMCPVEGREVSINVEDIK
jgi:hypothetical protein